MDFTQHFATRLMRLLTPQSEPVLGSTQVPNSGGGYSWPVDKWTRLDRFLVLGSEGGTYYIGERQLTQENALSVVECLAEDGPRVVRRVAEVSTAGRAPKNDPALFALAIAAGLGDAATKAAVWDALPRVARTGTHLFHWLQYLKACRGWGRGARRAVAAWYTGAARVDTVILSFDCPRGQTSSTIKTDQALRQGSVETRLKVDADPRRRIPSDVWEGEPAADRDREAAARAGRGGIEPLRGLLRAAGSLS